MVKKVTGSFPGGPSRSGDAPPRARPPRLSTVEEIERRNAEGQGRLRRAARRRRLAVGALISVLLGVAIGTAIGRQAVDSPAEIVADSEARRRQVDLSREVNRTLLQLWKMEDIEAARARGR